MLNNKRKCVIHEIMCNTNLTTGCRNDQSFYRLHVARISVCCIQGHLRELTIEVSELKIISELLS